MKKCKKIFIFSGIVICLITITLVIINSVNSDKVIYESDNANASDNRVISSNALTMMYETEAGSGEYQISSDTTWPQEGYVFNEELSACENGSELSWDKQNKRVIMSTSVSDKCYVYFDKVPTLTEYIKTEVYTGNDGDNGLYYHDGVGSYTNANQEAGDNSYRFSGANPNNYVCFGSDEETCPADNLYRIIGVFDGQVKIIKYDYAGESTLGTAPASNGTPNSSYYKGSLSSIPYYYWSSKSYYNNIWSSSTLNTGILNGTYLNTLGSEWTSKIATTTWHLGGMDGSDSTAKEFYGGERNNAGYGSNPTTYTDKIGLIYPSDYGYATSPENWNATLLDYGNSTITANNWMYMGAFDWIITTLRNPFHAFRLNDTGVLSAEIVGNGLHGVRPSFYLNSDVAYVSGDGSQNSPFRIQ